MHVCRNTHTSGGNGDRKTEKGEMMYPLLTLMVKLRILEKEKELIFLECGLATSPCTGALWIFFLKHPLLSHMLIKLRFNPKSKIWIVTTTVFQSVSVWLQTIECWREIGCQRTTWCWGGTRCWRGQWAAFRSTCTTEGVSLCLEYCCFVFP